MTLQLKVLVLQSRFLTCCWTGGEQLLKVPTEFMVRVDASGRGLAGAVDVQRKVDIWHGASLGAGGCSAQLLCGCWGVGTFNILI